MNNIVYLRPSEWDRYAAYLDDWVPMIVRGKMSYDDVTIGYRPQLLGM